MSEIRDDYLKFSVDDDEKSGSNSFMNGIIKVLVLLLLVMGVVVLGAVAYKYLFKEDKSATVVEKIQPITKEEQIAAIVNAVVEKMNKNKPQGQQTTVSTKEITNEVSAQMNGQNPNSNTDSNINDKQLLTQLESTPVEEEQNLDISELDDLDTKKEIKTASKKTVDTFNKVIVNKKELATKDDLAKLYAKLNSIMKKDKQRAKSSYTNMISKETKVRANEMRIIVVKRGDTLSKIAARAYGDAMMYHKIYEANPDIIKNPNLIHIGQRLRVPK